MRPKKTPEGLTRGEMVLQGSQRGPTRGVKRGLKVSLVRISARIFARILPVLYMVSIRGLQALSHYFMVRLVAAAFLRRL